MERTEKTYQSVAAAAIDGRLMNLQKAQISTIESVVEDVNRLERLVSELSDAGHNVSDLKKRVTLLRGLHQEFEVILKVIRMSEKTFAEPVSHGRVGENSKEEQDKVDRAVIRRYQSSCKKP